MPLAADVYGSVPSEMWHAVERIVVDCDFDATVDPQLRASLCRQLRAEVQKLTSLHVTLATRADLDPRSGNLVRRQKQLLLKIDARLTGGKDGAQSLLVSVLPNRGSGRTWEGAWSRPSSVSVAWKGRTPVVGSPVRSLQLLFAGTHNRGRPPLRSDRY